MDITPQKSIRYKRPSTKLFDKIIFAIKQERELKHSRKILFSFLFLLIFSIITMPLSYAFVVKQWTDSGVFYFMLMAKENMGQAGFQWRDFLLPIFESLPVLSTILFFVDVAVALFTLRLFLYKRGLLLKFIKHNFILGHG